MGEFVASRYIVVGHMSAFAFSVASLIARESMADRVSTPRMGRLVRCQQYLNGKQMKLWCHGY